MFNKTFSTGYQKEVTNLLEKDKGYSVENQRYQEVKKLMSNLEKTSLYTQFKMACSYHDIAQRKGLDEAIKLWLDKYKWDQKRPRFTLPKKEREQEGEDVKKYID